MSPEMYGYTLVGSVLGALTGVLIAWTRNRASAPAPLGFGQRVLLVLGGSGASAGALVAFARVFGASSVPYAPVATILLTGWVGILGAALPLPVPGFVLRVRPAEFRILRDGRTGIPGFGKVLRHTCLRHLGGPVYLAETGRDLRAALVGMEAAERLHLWAIAGSVPWLAGWLVRGQWLSLACACAVHIPLNLLPILHLRLAIARTERCLLARERRRSAATWRRHGR